MPKASKSKSQPQTQNEPVFNKVLRTLEQAREQATKAQQFVNIEIARTDNLVLEVTINPSGTPALIIHTPKLTNRLVLRSVSMLDELKRLAELALRDDEKLSAVQEFLMKYGYNRGSRGAFRITL